MTSATPTAKAKAAETRKIITQRGTGISNL